MLTFVSLSNMSSCTYHGTSVENEIVRLLLTTEPQFRSNLQVEIVVDIASSDDMRIEIFLTTCGDCPVNIMPKLLSFCVV